VPPRPSRRRALAAAAAVVAAGVAFGTAAPVGVATASSTDCPAGYLLEKDVALSAFADGARSQCVPALRPEPLDEVMGMNTQLEMRSSSGLPVAAGARAAATAQHQAMIAAAASKGAPSWIPMGKGPLNSDVPGYDEVNGLGLHQVSGRIVDFAYDPADQAKVYAAVANGGVWETTNAGKSWHSIGDKLPTQITGAVELIRNGKAKTLLAGTGDPAFGGSSYSGLGVFWSKGDGRWTRSKGVPNDSLTFNIDHDPKKPSVVYVATSRGLYRSSDTGRSFTNVGLPTGCTDVKKATCFFANIVTDVVVRRSGRGTGGGEVLAAVGWRAGRKLNAQGQPQSPRNGLYRSANGTKGSFSWLSNPGQNNVPLGVPTGFATDDLVGRVALGNATGALQSSGYVYALVQDAQKFNKAAFAFDIPEPTGKVPGNTVFNGLYGSTDFGVTWTKLADATQLQIPGSGTALSGAQGATYAPGIQSWYNEWIQVDPTVQDESGVPSRIAFGLEEVWTGSGAILPVPNTGRYRVVGRYFSGQTCGGLGGTLWANGCPLNATPEDPSPALAEQGPTTHPDQHAGLFVPKDGGVVLWAGNDGGAYKQTVARGADLTNNGWGKGHNDGFQTLLPYDVAISSDGTAVMGLQDNGSAVITPKGKQIMAYGGDGFFVAVDPYDSNVWYEEYVGGTMSKTTNGGKSWTSIDPGLTGALFSTPFVMDTQDPRHLVVGGREIKETTNGGSAWTTVFDLGTQAKPGDANDGRSPTGPDPVVGLDPLATGVNNQMSAVDTYGDVSYVAYCGYCDIVTGGVPFKSGLATNYGGSKEPRAGSANGWHMLPAKGLPQRYINSVRIDPHNMKTIYVTLGGYGRKWIPPGSLGDDTSKIGKGHVFKSTDGGRTFKNISGNLPDIAANDAVVFNGRLVVATELGTYTGDVNGKQWQVLGKGLPNAPVFRLNRSPRNPRELVAASYGRGAFRIVLPAGYAGQPKKVKTVFAAEGAVNPTAIEGAGGTASGSAGQQGTPSAPGKSGSPTSVDAAKRSLPGGSDRLPWLPVTLAALLTAAAAVAVRRARQR